MADRWEEIERIGGRPDPSDVVWFQAFANCAASACLFELCARRYADNTPELQRVAFKDLSDVMSAICAHVSARTSQEERAFLGKCVRIRNKLLHLELSKASGQLRSLGFEIGSGGVAKVDLATGEPTMVAVTSTQGGRIFGWLLESTTSGAFSRATETFTRGRRLLQWLRIRDVEEGGA